MTDTALECPASSSRTFTAGLPGWLRGDGEVRTAAPTVWTAQMAVELRGGGWDRRVVDAVPQRGQTER